MQMFVCPFFLFVRCQDRQESHTVAGKPHDATVNFDRYRVYRQFVRFDTLVTLVSVDMVVVTLM